MGASLRGGRADNILFPSRCENDCSSTVPKKFIGNIVHFRKGRPLRFISSFVSIYLKTDKSESEEKRRIEKRATETQRVGNT